MSMKKKLTNIQKRAAQLLCIGFKVAKTAKILDLNDRTIYRWKNRTPRFMKYMDKLNNEFSAYINQKKYAMLDKVFKRLNTMLDASDGRKVMFAVDALLKINRQFPDTSKVNVAHTGMIEQQHKGEVSIEHLSDKKKHKIKELLELTREASSDN